ncbi:hypothetical protein [Staphylococcus hyicus]|uniref:Uncharacterized protein n=2 Tax=Staphylococcus hyicus TaxID=1284 RepID=A0A0A8HUX8_STAHY|nr:hypothetical protein [Staphylococcus hyicus]AJC96779.1 hypothetical protein SHYC_10250 [Staphylococcus hyicus]MCE5153550.1 hypothetical protein [Staphylococcus hyicus]MDP4448855.1 hypothetical protein [Staphylococcus hyicus]MDP4461806.1 hypothetical protein [Staphylococcus hyicus]MDP4463951.1 hypothetical protein [Staphylococcus hyicus]
MAHDSKRQQFIFMRNMIALPYVIFAIMLMIIVLFSPQLIWFVAITGVFMVYHVIATFIAFLLKYGKICVLLLCMTLAVVGVFAAILHAFLILHS